MQNSEVIPSTRRYRYYDLLLVAFVTVLLCSNLIGAGKAATITLPWLGEVTYGAGILFFPISYLFGDILTEVYGYAHDRRAVWAGFAALSFAAVMSLVVVSLTPAQNAYMQEYQHGLETVFGNTWRIVIASITAFWAGSLANRRCGKYPCPRRRRGGRSRRRRGRGRWCSRRRWRRAAASGTGCWALVFLVRAGVPTDTRAGSAEPFKEIIKCHLVNKRRYNVNMN